MKYDPSYNPSFGDTRCGLVEDQRQAVVAEARSWLRTPYHHRAHVKGGGVDCAYLILEAFVGAGVHPRFDPGRYNHDWHLHRSEERYLSVVEEHMARIDDTEAPFAQRPEFSAEPGDVLMWRLGRTFSHGAIVTRWPWIIHSYFPARMVEEVDLRGTPMAVRPMRAYSYWGTR